MVSAGLWSPAGLRRTKQSVPLVPRLPVKWEARCQPIVSERECQGTTLRVTIPRQMYLFILQIFTDSQGHWGEDCEVEDCLFHKPCSLALMQDLLLNQSFEESVIVTSCHCFPHPIPSWLNDAEEPEPSKLSVSFPHKRTAGSLMFT